MISVKKTRNVAPYTGTQNRSQALLTRALCRHHHTASDSASQSYMALSHFKPDLMPRAIYQDGPHRCLNRMGAGWPGFSWDALGFAQLHCAEPGCQLESLVKPCPCLQAKEPEVAFSHGCDLDGPGERRQVPSSPGP